MKPDINLLITPIYLLMTNCDNQSCPELVDRSESAKIKAARVCVWDRTLDRRKVRRGRGGVSKGGRGNEGISQIYRMSLFSPFF